MTDTQKELDEAMETLRVRSINAGLSYSHPTIANAIRFLLDAYDADRERKIKHKETLKRVKKAYKVWRELSANVRSRE